MGQISGPTLYLFFQAGCDHCAAAKRFLGPFREAHPNLLFVELDVSKFPWEIAKYTPKMTPAYLLTINRTAVWNHEGVLNEQGLKKIDVEIARWST